MDFVPYSFFLDLSKNIITSSSKRATYQVLKLANTITLLTPSIGLIR
jgi:hypothetical protein